MYGGLAKSIRVHIEERLPFAAKECLVYLFLGSPYFATCREISGHSIAYPGLVSWEQPLGLLSNESTLTPP
jgi:hypothetical protein